MNIQKQKEIGIGMLGYGMMGRFHSNGFLRMPYVFTPPPAWPILRNMCGVPEDAVKKEAQKYGYSKYCTEWKELVNDESVDVVDVGVPNDLHAEICIEAAAKNKHIICEKPLARNAEEAGKMLEAVKAAGVKHVCDFNYRLVPALVLAKKMIDEGRLGKIYHFRANYLQDWAVDPAVPRLWRFDQKRSGTGALGDFSHIVDLARWFCGEPDNVMGIMKNFIPERTIPGKPGVTGVVDVDDSFVSILEFKSGASGMLEGSRLCPGRKNYMSMEINGEKGSIIFDLEHMNYLSVYLSDENSAATEGFKQINVTAPVHPYGDVWGPYGMEIGWENLYVHAAYHMIDAIVNDKKITPQFADFEDGYRAAVICDAISESAETGRKAVIAY